MMRGTTRNWALAATCGLVCVGCPAGIVYLGYAYGFDRLPSDADFRTWPLDVVDGLLWADAVATAGLIWSLRSSWLWLGTAVVVPLFGLTAALAVLGGMWIEGTYW